MACNERWTSQALTFAALKKKFYLIYIYIYVYVCTLKGRFSWCRAPVHVSVSVRCSSKVRTATPRVTTGQVPEQTSPRIPQVWPPTVADGVLLWGRRWSHVGRRTGGVPRRRDAAARAAPRRRQICVVSTLPSSQAKEASCNFFFFLLRSLFLCQIIVFFFYFCRCLPPSRALQGRTR